MNLRGFVRSAVCSALLLGATASTASAATILVTPGNADSTATCTASPCPNLRSAIGFANANPGTTLSLAAGTYSLSIGEVLISANTTIAGAGSNVTKIRETHAGDRVLETSSGTTVVLRNVEITGGNLQVAGDPAGTFTSPRPSANGGGILDGGSSLTLDGVLVDQNTATGGDGGGSATNYGGQGANAQGGGIAQTDSSGTLTITNSSIVGNTAGGGKGGDSTNPATSGGVTGGQGGVAWGGGVYAFGTLNASDSTFAQNLASAGDGGSDVSLQAQGGQDGSGGGVFGGGIAAGTAVLQRVTVNSNAIAGGFGGVNSSDSKLDGDGGNAWGGGIILLAGGTVINSTVEGNTATGQGDPGYFDQTGGFGFGGGIAWFSGAGPQMGFFSDTLDGNTAASTHPKLSSGGNLYVTGNGINQSQPVLRDTIIAGGTAAAYGNCWALSQISDGGYNLDDQPTPSSPPEQCGLSAAKHDLIDVAPKLSALADNGGPTQTMALAAGSPAIAAGGACVDAAKQSPFPALKIDQRGLPRPAVCDIGAFQQQAQPPANTGAPTISGTLAVGQKLTCNKGTWSGHVLSYTYQWNRDGTAIPGATGATYVVQPGDAGRQLTCTVTATGSGGGASATSAAVTIPAPPGPSGSGPPGGGNKGSHAPGKVTIPHQTITFHSGRGKVHVKCTGDSFCSGVLRITITMTPSGAYIASLPHKHKGGGGPRHLHKFEVLVLAHVTFLIPPGKVTTVRIKLLSLGRQLLSAHGHLSATVRVVATGAKKQIRRVVGLV